MVPAWMAALPSSRRPRRGSPEALSDASSSAIARAPARSRPSRSGARDTPRRRCHKRTSIPVPRGVEDPPDALGPATVSRVELSWELVFVQDPSSTLIRLFPFQNS